MGNSEGLDPLQTNVFVRKSYAGEFICLNKYLVEDLIRLVTTFNIFLTLLELMESKIEK